MRDEFLLGGAPAATPQPASRTVAQSPGVFRERIEEVSDGAIRRWQYTAGAEPFAELELVYRDTSSAADTGTMTLVVSFDSPRPLVPDADTIVLTARDGRRLTLAATWTGVNDATTGHIRERVTSSVSIDELERISSVGAFEVMIHGESFVVRGNAGGSLREFVDRMGGRP